MTEKRCCDANDANFVVRTMTFSPLAFGNLDPGVWESGGCSGVTEPEPTVEWLPSHYALPPETEAETPTERIVLSILKDFPFIQHNDLYIAERRNN